ncbi:MAG: anaerobic ribonucleoside-triphosphate reductase activating protein [archaeon]
MAVKDNIKGFVPTSLVDWDGKVSAVIFLPGCNFRCSFCSNPDLVVNTDNIKTIPFQEVKKVLENNNEFIDGVVITGGEPTIFSDFPDFCQKIKEMGFKVKIDTNGTNPEMLKELLDKEVVDFAAMDVKTDFDKYKEVVNAEVDLEKIKNSIELIKQFPEYEFRITMFPKISKEDLIKAADYLKEKGAKTLIIQQFRNDTCLDKAAEDVKPYSEEQLKEMKAAVETGFEKCVLRNA